MNHSQSLREEQQLLVCVELEGVLTRVSWEDLVLFCVLTAQTMANVVLNKLLNSKWT